MEDILTKLASRRCFNVVLDREIRRVQRSGEFLSLIMADIDFSSNTTTVTGIFAAMNA
jgi:GGDEF domain-containing protein